MAGESSSQSEATRSRRPGPPPPANSRDWEVGLCDCWYIGTGCCLVAFCLPCIGDRFVQGLALSKMEKNTAVLFHCICASFPMARNYFAEAYQLKSRPGWNCCIGCCCRPCHAAQLYGHVLIAGPPTTLPQTNPTFAAHFGGMPVDWKDTVCLDPCNCLHTGLLCHCISAGHVAQVTNLPVWVPCLYSNYCFNHHILRVDLGVPGSTNWNDCIEPLICFVLAFVLGGAMAPCCCCYYAQMLENERNLVRKAVKIQAPRLLLQPYDIDEVPTNETSSSSITITHQPKTNGVEMINDTRQGRSPHRHRPPTSSESIDPPPETATSTSHSNPVRGWIDWLEARFGPDLSVAPLQFTRSVSRRQCGPPPSEQPEATTE